MLNVNYPWNVNGLRKMMEFTSTNSLELFSDAIPNLGIMQDDKLKPWYLEPRFEEGGYENPYLLLAFRVRFLLVFVVAVIIIPIVMSLNRLCKGKCKCLRYARLQF